MVPDSYVAQYDAFNPCPPKYQRKKNCHKFNADSILGRSAKAYDISGIVTLLCRCVTQLCPGGGVTWICDQSLRRRP
jgi:hypothetical protein